jgi:hypothetical protein
MDIAKWLRLQWDRAAAWACAIAGAVALIIGWIGVSGSGYPAEQNAYIISGGIGGMFLLGIGGSMWVSADLRDEWRKLDRLEAALRDLGAKNMTISVEPVEGRPEARRVTFAEETPSLDVPETPVAAYSGKSH